MAESQRFEPQKRARRRALQALYQWQITGQPASEIFHQFLAEQDFSNVDEGLFRALVNGVIDQIDTLDARLEPILDRPMDHLAIMEKIILRMGVLQLTRFAEVPYQVVLDESVELARQFGSSEGHAYINAVLDKLAAKDNLSTQG